VSRRRQAARTELAPPHTVEAHVSAEIGSPPVPACGGSGREHIVQPTNYTMDVSVEPGSMQPTKHTRFNLLLLLF
jgi:hypothetical protein